MKTMECAICGGEANLVTEEREVFVGKRSAIVEDEFHRCSVCEEELYSPEQSRQVMMRASASIRRQMGLLVPSEIRSIRESMGLSQSEFERLLGVGPKTVVRWERGTVFQNRATDVLLRTLRDVAGVAEYLGHRSGVLVSTALATVEEAPVVRPRATISVSDENLETIPDAMMSEMPMAA